MKLASFNDYRIGIVVKGGIVDGTEMVSAEITALPGAYRMQAVIERFDEVRSALAGIEGHTVIPIERVELRAPVPRPVQLLAAAVNFREGIDGPVQDIDMFLKSSNAILQPGGTVVLPDQPASVFHHEAELAVVIGRRGKRIPPSEAMRHVFGYTGIIDVSARGFDSVANGVGYRDKSFDGFAPLGPWIVTADEVGNPDELWVRLSVDGQLRQNYPMSDIAHSIGDLISWCSNVTTLEPGDIIACGTNHQGLGALQDGDRVSLDIDRIGILEVHVADPLKREWLHGIDPKIGPIATELRRRHMSKREGVTEARAQFESTAETSPRL